MGLQDYFKVAFGEHLEFEIYSLNLITDIFIDFGMSIVERPELEDLRLHSAPCLLMKNLNTTISFVLVK